MAAVETWLPAGVELEGSRNPGTMEAVAAAFLDAWRAVLHTPVRAQKVAGCLAKEIASRSFSSVKS